MIACDGDGRARTGSLRARRRCRRPHPLRGGPSIATATAARGMASTASRGRSSITAVAPGLAANAFLTCRPMGSTASGDVCSGNTACPTPFAATPAPRWRRMACTDSIASPRGGYSAGSCINASRPRVRQRTAPMHAGIGGSKRRPPRPQPRRPIASRRSSTRWCRRTPTGGRTKPCMTRRRRRAGTSPPVPPSGSLPQDAPARSGPVRGPSRQPRGHRSMAPRAAMPPSGPQPRDHGPRSPGRRVARDFRRDPARSLRRAHPHHPRRAITPERLFTMSPDNVSPTPPLDPSSPQLVSCKL